MTETIASPKIEKVENAAPTIKDYGLLKPATTLKYFICYLPSGYKSVIVNYAPVRETGNWSLNGGDALKISCVMPPVTHKVKLRYLGKDATDDDREHQKSPETHTVKHRSPDSVWSIGYPGAPVSDFIHYGLPICAYTIDGSIKDKIMGAPYLMPNVAPNAQICFGSVGMPADLRSAYNIFWTSPFNYLNSSYGPLKSYRGAVSNVDYVRRYKSLIIKNEENYSDITSKICGKKFWSTTQQAPGILVSSNTALLTLIDKKHWTSGTSENIVIALAEPGEKEWTFTNKFFKFKLPSEMIFKKKSKK